MSKLRREVFIVLYLCDGRFRANADYDCIGTKNYVSFPDIGCVVLNCKRLKCDSILLIHNHPYERGLETFFLKEYYPEPSVTDISSTKIFTEFVSKEGINVMDHIIITGDGQYFSFFENNLL